MLSWCYITKRLKVKRNQKVYLLIKDISDDVDPKSLPIVCKSIAHFGQKECEPAGRNYHQWCLVKSGLVKHEGEENEDESAKGGETEESKRRKEWEENEKHKFDDDTPEANYYEVLGIGHIGVNATEGQIKKAYQKMLLKYHPDKMAGETGADAADTDPRFLAVQKAWDILGTPKRRRGYDSQFDFDERIPSGAEDLENGMLNFYELYGPVFYRNARFSVKTPVPALGDESSEIKKVQDFYRFWNRFESWREFSHADEHSPEDLEGAECREEKRWMMRQNENARAKKKKKEYERIRNLVERAQKRDPRLLKYTRDLKEAKEAARNAKINARLEKERAEKEAKEKEIREKEEAARVKKEAESAARKQKQNQKKAFKKQVKKMDKALEAAYRLLEVSLAEREQVDGDAHEISQDVTQVALIKRVVAAFDGMDPESTSEESLAAARAGVDAVSKAKNGELTEDAAPKPAPVEPKAAPAQENIEENNKPVESKPEKKEIPFTETELSLLARAFSKFPGGTRNRWEQIEQYMHSNIKEGVVYERARDVYIAKAKSIEQDALEKRRREKEGASEPDSPPSPADGKTVEDVWSIDQQKKLEEALKEFPATLEKNERWAAIANAVGDKTKKQCVERYKTLRASVLAKKAQA